MTSRLLAGLLPGFLLATLISGALCWAWPGPWTGTLVPTLLLMFPAWLAVISLCMVARSGLQAWLLTGLPAVAGLAALSWARQAGWLG